MFYSGKLAVQECVAAGFMPAFKYHQRILLAVLERGHKARGYVFAHPASDAHAGVSVRILWFELSAM